MPMMKLAVSCRSVWWIKTSLAIEFCEIYHFYIFSTKYTYSILETDPLKSGVIPGSCCHFRANGPIVFKTFNASYLHHYQLPSASRTLEMNGGDSHLASIQEWLSWPLASKQDQIYIRTWLFKTHPLHGQYTVMTLHIMSNAIAIP